MKKTIKNLAFILMLVVAFTCIAVQASAADANDLTFVAYDDGVMLTACDKNATGELTIPAEYNGKKVVKIGDRAFEECLNLTKVSIPDSVKVIGDSAFGGCLNLAEVAFPYDLEEIGSHAFFACDALKSVTLYPNVKEIGAYAFVDCENLESVVIPDKITVINEGTFSQCAKLTKIFIPYSVDVVDYNAFLGCSSIKEVYYVGTLNAWESLDWTEGNESLFAVLFNVDNKKNAEHSHTFTETVIVPSGCETYGTSMKTCACGFTYRDDKVKPLEHVRETIPAVPATCEETGKSSGEKCSRCDKILIEPQTTAAKGHGTLQVLPAVATSCSQSGLTEGSRCIVCNKDVVKQEVIEKLPHDFKNAEIEPATTEKNGKIKGFCTVCNASTETELYSVTVTELAKTSYTYNGKARKPGVTVKDSAGNTLVSGEDYDITYAKGRKNPGVYEVKVVLKGNYEGTITRSFTIIPTKAENVKAKASKVNAVKLTWDEVPGATGYRIYIYKSASSDEKVKLTAATTNSYDLTKDFAGKKLVMGTKYKVSITPYTKASNGKYVFAKEATVLTFKFAPSAPTLKAASNAKGKVTLEWSNVAAETGYKVYISTDGKTYKLYKTHKGWPDKQTYSSDLKAGTKYYFKVRAYTVVDSKTTVYGSYSAVKTVTVKK